MAPDFTLPATTGDKVTLSSFRGKAPVVLAFFPAAFTGGCTKEMLAYQANFSKFEGAATKVFGVSGDGPSGIPLAIVSETKAPIAQVITAALRREKAFRVLTTDERPHGAQPLTEAAVR